MTDALGLSRATACSSSCRCSTPTPGAYRTPRRSPVPTWCCRTASCRPSRWRADRSRAPDGDGLRADDLRRPAALRRRAPRSDLSSLKNAACGGSAVPKQLMEDFQERHGVRIFQAWGMTETSPVATYSRPARRRARGRLLGGARQAGQAAAVGRAAAGGRRRREVPWDGRVHGRDRGARPVGRRALLQRRLRASASSTPAGCARATSRRWTSMRSCRSPTAPRT